MIFLEPGLYLRVQQLSERPHPLPLENGFSIGIAYRALGIYSPSETSECYFILANDREEMWFVSNRHFRAVGLFPERRDLRFALNATSAPETLPPEVFRPGSRFARVSASTESLR